MEKEEIEKVGMTPKLPDDDDQIVVVAVEKAPDEDAEDEKNLPVETEDSIEDLITLKPETPTSIQPISKEEEEEEENTIADEEKPRETGTPTSIQPISKEEEGTTNADEEKPGEKGTPTSPKPIFKGEEGNTNVDEEKPGETGTPTSIQPISKEEEEEGTTNADEEKPGEKGTPTSPKPIFKGEEGNTNVDEEKPGETGTPTSIQPISKEEEEEGTTNADEEKPGEKGTPTSPKPIFKGEEGNTNVDEEKPGETGTPTSIQPISKEEEEEGTTNADEEKPGEKGTPTSPKPIFKGEEGNTNVDEEKPGETGTPTSIQPISKEEEEEGTTNADEEKPGETGGIPTPPKLEMTEEVDERKLMPNSALNIGWSFGFNQSIPVWNLTDENRTLIMYTSSHAGIVYDYKANSQSILQGHANSISCTFVSKDKKWLVTADKGKDNTVIVWDTRTFFPVRTLFSVSSDGMEAIALSPDSKYLVTMSAGNMQEFVIWDWTIAQDKPLASVTLNPRFSGQNYIFFCEENMSYIVSNSEHQVIFYQWKDDTINYFAPSLTDQDFHIAIGKYSQSIIIADTIHALTGTSNGNLVVWDTDIFGVEGKKRKIANKKAAKIIQLVSCGITVLTLQDTNLVIGDSFGNVSFFDQRMTLLHCFNNIGLGPVKSISFCLAVEDESNRNMYPETCTMGADNIVFPDFIISTLSARCGYVKILGAEVQVILSDHGKPIPAIATHPFKPFLATGSRAGKLKVYNYIDKVSVGSCSFDKEIIESCAFSPDGYHLALGFHSGVIKVLDSFTLKAEKHDVHDYCKHAIIQVIFSDNSKYLAAADAGFATSLLKKEDSSFVFIGRYQAHYKPIRMLMFGEKFNEEEPRLLSLGEDRMLVEYDLVNSSEDNVKISSIERIEQSATPRCMAWHPPLNKEHFIVTANDQYKYKLYNSMTMMCRKTVLGPIYENPIEKLIVLPKEGINPEHMYMAFITQDKVGLQILPFDGNPHQSTGLIAHPGGVHNFVASNDGMYLFTTSSEECSVHMWDINPSALEAQVQLGGQDLIPFYRLLDGGREGEFFEELKEYFYYCQLRSSDINSMQTRKVTTVIPITQIPYMMRALGFYPSEQELANMINEVKYSDYVDKGEFKELLDLPEFLKLYINHRPYRDLTGEKLKWAFGVLGEWRGESGNSSFPTNEMLSLIQTQGEHITSEEFDEILMDLCLLDLDCSNKLGNYKDGGKIKDFSHLAGFIDLKLPTDMTAETFAFNLLDLPENTFNNS